MRRFATLLLALLMGGCASYGVSWTQTANDAIACAVAITSEVAAGQADPALIALGHSPSAADIALALQHAQAMLPATIAACAAFVADFSLPTTPGPVPPARAAELGPKVANPWRR